MSEEGRCNFIFAGFWDLYEAAILDNNSPLKNFGDSVIVGKLEYEACRELATKPMAMLGINYTSEKLVEHIVKQTGQKANLIAIVCDQILNNLENGQQTVNQEDVENALQSRAVTESLPAFVTLTENEQASRLDRFIVYLTVEKGTFTFTEIIEGLDDYLINHTTEQLSQSLARLELAYSARRSIVSLLCSIVSTYAYATRFNRVDKIRTRINHYSKRRVSRASDAKRFSETFASLSEPSVCFAKPTFYHSIHSPILSGSST